MPRQIFQRAYAKADFQRAYAKADFQRAYAKVETVGESSRILAGATPGRIEDDSAVVSRVTRKILSPFGRVRMYSLPGPLGLIWVNLG